MWRTWVVDHKKNVHAHALQLARQGSNAAKPFNLTTKRGHYDVDASKNMSWSVALAQAAHQLGHGSGEYVAVPVHPLLGIARLVRAPNGVFQARALRELCSAKATVQLEQERVPVLVHELRGKEAAESRQMAAMEHRKRWKHGEALVPEGDARAAEGKVALGSDSPKLRLNFRLPTGAEESDVVADKEKEVAAFRATSKNVPDAAQPATQVRPQNLEADCGGRHAHVLEQRSHAALRVVAVEEDVVLIHTDQDADARGALFYRGGALQRGHEGTQLEHARFAAVCDAAAHRQQESPDGRRTRQRHGVPAPSVNFSADAVVEEAVARLRRLFHVP